MFWWLRGLFHKREGRIQCALCGWSTDDIPRMHDHILAEHGAEKDCMSIPPFRV